MANTPFLDLVKPAGTDRALVSVINSNSDKIDTGVSTLSEQIANYTNSGIQKQIAGTDLNTLKVAGRYFYTNTCSNRPSTSDGYIDVYVFSSNYAKQIAHETVTYKSYVRYCNNGTWSAWQELITRSDISSSSGGVPIRKAGSVANNGSFQVEISSDYSVNEGFALVALNLSGNGYAGMALLALGRGTEKKKDILGNMTTSYYSATYSNGVWTITNTSGSAMYYTVILSK